LHLKSPANHAYIDPDDGKLLALLLHTDIWAKILSAPTLDEDRLLRADIRIQQQAEVAFYPWFCRKTSLIVEVEAPSSELLKRGLKAFFENPGGGR
jgi:hypothetical protein